MIKISIEKADNENKCIIEIKKEFTYDETKTVKELFELAIEKAIEEDLPILKLDCNKSKKKTIKG